MKKRNIVLVLMVCVVIAFCGCDSAKPSTEQPVTTTSVVDVTTTNLTTVPTTETTSVSEEPALNTTLFDDIGRSFEQLSEQYGEVSLAFYDEGGPIYRFENGESFYSFDGFYEVEGGYGSIPLTEDGYWDLSVAPIPEADDVCTGIYYATASTVFTELAEPMEAAALAQQYHLGELDAGQSLMTAQYIVAFEMDGYRLRMVCEDDTYTVRPDPYVHIQAV